MSKTGTYIVDPATGQVVKVSDRVPIIKKVPVWHRELNADNDKRAAYASLERRGKLNEVNDAECRPVR
jgi:hypothetical protein